MQKDQMIFIDLETTGIEALSDRVCQIGAIFPSGEEYETLINPIIKIPAQATEIHGITNDMVQDAPIFENVAEKLIKELEQAKYFVAYNSLFDFQFLQAELHRAIGYDLNESKFTFVDPYKIFKKMFPHNLSNAYKFYMGKELEGAHSAMVDVKAAMDVLEKQHHMYPEFFSRGYEEVESLTVGDTMILGKWFNVDNDKKITFRLGKYKGKEVKLEHADYLKWISTLSDTTISEKRFIQNAISGALV